MVNWLIMPSARMRFSISSLERVSDRVLKLSGADDALAWSWRPGSAGKSRHVQDLAEPRPPYSALWRALVNNVSMNRWPICSSVATLCSAAAAAVAVRALRLGKAAMYLSGTQQLPK